MPFAGPAAPGCSGRWLSGLAPGYPAVLITAPPDPVDIGEFGERGDVSIGTGGYRLRVQVRELREKRVSARMDNAELPAEVIVMRDVGHTPRLGIFRRDTSGIVAPNTASIRPDIHVCDRALTAVMNVDPQQLAGATEPLDLNLRQVGGLLPEDLASLLLVRLALLRTRPDGPGSQANRAEPQDRSGVGGDLRGRGEHASKPKPGGQKARRSDGG
jgi:hypothetical protein